MRDWAAAPSGSQDAAVSGEGENAESCAWQITLPLQDPSACASTPIRAVETRGHPEMLRTRDTTDTSRRPFAVECTVAGEGSCPKRPPERLRKLVSSSHHAVVCKASCCHGL